jgi:hypothetical protein
VSEVAYLLFAQERRAAWVVQYVPGRVAIVAGEHARDERACEGVYAMLVGGVDDGQAEAHAEYCKLWHIRQAGVGCCDPGRTPLARTRVASEETAACITASAIISPALKGDIHSNLP